MKLRIQHGGRKHAVEISDAAIVSQLTDLVEGTINESEFTMKAGFPPKPLALGDPTLTLAECGIRSGETLIVDVSHKIPRTQAMSTASFRQIEQEKSTRAVQEGTAVPHIRQKEILQESSFSFGGSGKGQSPQSDETLPPEVTVPGHGIMTLRVQPDDNSCLFRAIGYLCMRSIDAMEELRQLIASTIQQNPAEYSDAVLGMSRDAYCTKMNRADTWGGEIEMKILSDHFNIQIASIDCKTGHIYRYGERFKDCIYIVYSGIHYDALAVMPATGSPPEWDQTQFTSGDVVIEKAAQDLVGVLRKRNYFTDTASFDLRCNTCGTGLKGEKGAQEHATKTGHVNFGEYQSE